MKAEVKTLDITVTQITNTPHARPFLGTRSVTAQHSSNTLIKMKVGTATTLCSIEISGKFSASTYR